MSFASNLKSLAFNFKFIAVVYFVLTATISLIQYNQGGKTFDGKAYTRYNNYVIFKNSYYHLANNQNPYQLWPEEHWDLYKYSPTFALLMYPFTLIPDSIGLMLWNLINAFALFMAFYYSKHFDGRSKAIMLLFVLPELVISLQNSQSNGLVAGLMIAAFNLFEQKKFRTATLLISLCTFIKLFGIVAFSFAIFYKERWKSAAISIFWMGLMVLLPLIVISLTQLKADYVYWGEMLANDQNVSMGLSVLGWIKTWFGYDAPKNLVTAVGMLLLLLPLLKFSLYNQFKFRILMLASMMIWVVIFNHKAESPTFIIAIAGAATWFFVSTPSKVNIILLTLAFVFSSLSPTDIFPKFLRVNYVAPYVLKAVPLIFLWIKIQFDLLTLKKETESESTETVIV